MDDNTTLLPILIIPGFMSSGLEVKESNLVESWVGKRLWISLAAIGISQMYFGKAQKREAYSDPDDEDFEDDDEAQQYSLKSKWMKHILLGQDHISDPPGVKVRAIPGFDGVSYITPGTFTNSVSYVFGPVIDKLKEIGYNAGGKTNLMAAPNDWRMAPCTLEERDQYFTKTIGMIEELYNNNGSPVILLCHSLGCKAAHYLLNFVLEKKGQEWIDKHVHTYLVSSVCQYLLYFKYGRHASRNDRRSQLKFCVQFMFSQLVPFILVHPWPWKEQYLGSQ